MTDIDTQSQEPSEVSEQTPSESASPEPVKTEVNEAAASGTTEKYVPYDRFQEIIQQKNEFAKRLEEHERRYQALEAKVNKPVESPKKENALMNRLKTVDSEFGSWAETQDALRSELQELKEWRTRAEQERTRSEAQSEIGRLHSEYKVHDDLKEFYTDRLRSEVGKLESSGRVLSVKDLASVYKTVHESANKLFEAQRRAAIANYSTSKKTDATPTLKKGVAPKPSTTKPSFSKDREEAKSQIVKQAMEQARLLRNS